MSQPIQRRRQRLTALVARSLFGLLAANGCASGFASSSEAPPSQPSASGNAGSSASSAEPCTVGERETCACPGGGQGMRACTADDTSPTNGSFSSCLLCTESSPSDNAGAAAATVGEPDSAGSVGANPANDPSNAAGRNGNSGSAGTTGSAANSGGNSNGRCNCNQSCFPLGVISCCRANGSCGCTWAPGAYCM